MSLALQVSPCLTLGLLLFASLSARAAGWPSDLGCTASRDGQRQQQAVQIAANTPLAAVTALTAFSDTCPPPLLCLGAELLLPDALEPADPASATALSQGAGQRPSSALLVSAPSRAP